MTDETIESNSGAPNMKTYGLSRGAIAAGLVALALGVFAMMPGAFGSALAQTAGGDETNTGTGTGTGTTTTGTDPTTGTTTTTTTGTDGTKTTETTKTDGTKSTETAKPNGETTTVVTIPNQGTVTIVQAPNQPVTVTVAPANPNTETSLQVEVLSAQLTVPGGALSADETISIVETSFNLAITLGVTRIENVTRLGDGRGTAVENFAAAGSIRAVKVFEMTVKKGDGTTGQIDKPLQMTWDFKPQDLAEAGGDFANLLMISYDAATKVWTPVKQVSHTATSATFEVPHFSLWAFAVRTPGAVTPPAATPAAGATPVAPGQVAPTPATGAPSLTPRPANTGTGIPAQSGTSAALPFAAAVLGLGLLGGIGLRTVRRRS